MVIIDYGNIAVAVACGKPLAQNFLYLPSPDASVSEANLSSLPFPGRWLDRLQARCLYRYRAPESIVRLLTSGMCNYFAAIALDDPHEFRNLRLRHTALIKRIAYFMRSHIEFIIGQAKMFV